MIKLNFVVDDNLLIIHTLKEVYHCNFSWNNNKDDLLNFSNYAVEYDNQVTEFLASNDYMWDYSDAKMSYIANNLLTFLDHMKKSKEFETIKFQTVQYKELTQDRWEKSYNNSYEFMLKMSWIELEGEFTVMITHPDLKNWVNIWKDNIIQWWHSEDWENYSVVYLWHEIMHNYLSNDDWEHSVIELLCDNSLRVYLNGWNYIDLEWHASLRSRVSKLLPLWLEYLENPTNIFQYMKMIKKD